MKVSIYDVAKKAGLSTVTVSRVINNSPKVRPYNRQKVLQAMQELGYSPSAAARSLAKGNTGVIGLVTPSINDHFFNSVAMSINYNLMNEGYFLAISLHHDNSIDETNSLYSDKNYLFQEGRVDGIIVLSPIGEDEYIEELERKKIPFILLDNQDVHENVYSILVDNYIGGYSVTKHLIELGHEKIGFIGGNEDYLSARERKRGFIYALKEAGFEPYIMDDGEFDIESGYNIMKKWIDEDRIPTAVFAADDNIALGTIDALRSENLQVPHDVSVCGYDNSTVAGKLKPNITTVEQPANEMGKKAVEILLRLIRGERPNYQTIKLQPQLIVRDSSKAPAR